MNTYINEIDKSYYKYFPTNECASFIFNYCKSFNFNLNEIFEKDIIDNKIIKSTYLKIILNSDEEQFKLYRNWKSHGEYEVGTNFVSDHAHGLKYGPSIYLTQDYMNVIKFSIHKSNIPKNSLTDIQKNIESNDRIQTRINELENTLTSLLNDKFGDKEDVKNNSREIQKIQDDINRLHKKILPITLPYEYIPNTKSHFERFHSTDFHNSNAFSSSLDDDSNRLIMNLDIDPNSSWHFYWVLGYFWTRKIFDEQDYTIYQTQLKSWQNLDDFSLSLQTPITYSESIINSHCYLGKDIKNITHEKIIQSIGRVGRKSQNSVFTFRFRNKEHINKFFDLSSGIETTNMNRLLC